MTDEKIIEHAQEISEQKETIRITKNSKGHQWEFKIFFDSNKIEESIDKCKTIDTEISKKFGVVKR